MNKTIAEYVKDKEASLAEGKDSDEVCEIVGHSRLAGTRIGLGLLYLGKVSEAQRWFAAVSEKWAFYVQFSREDILDLEDNPRVGTFEWLALVRALQTAVLSSDPEVIDHAAIIALEEATNPTLQELPGAEANPRVSAIAALATLLAGDDPSEHLNKLASRLEHADRPHDKTLYPVMSTIIDGLSNRDAEAVTEGITALESYHEEFTVGSDIAHFTEEAVNIDACAFIVLARRLGMDVQIDSEYVPEGVYDEEHYPLAGE